MRSPDHIRTGRPHILRLALWSVVAACAAGTEPPPSSQASVATSSVSLSAATVVSGSSVAIALQAKDAAGNSLTTAGLTVAFALGTGTSNGTFGPVTDEGNGRYSATFTGTTAGSARAVTATLSGAPVATPMPSITVTPGPISTAQSSATVSAASIASGSTTTLTLQARDAAGNALAAGGATVAFSLGGSGTSTATIGTVTDNASGTYAATLTGVVAGSARAVNANINGTAVTSAAPTVTVTPGSASTATSTITTANNTLASGNTTTVTLTAKDAAGNSLSSGGATVAFSLSGSGTSAGTIGAVTDNANGTYGAVLTATTAGTARGIAGTLNGGAVTTLMPSITVTPGAVSVAQSTVETSASSIAVGGTAALTARAKDAAGNALTTGGLTVAFTKGSGTSDGTIGAVTDNANGTYGATFTGTTAGDARTIGATINGAAITTTLPTITVASTTGPIASSTSVVATSASTVTSGSSVTITLQAKDANGTNLGTGGATVAFSLGSGTSTGTIGTVTDNANGTYTATLTGVLVGTARAVNATINGSAVTTTAPTVTVTPGAVSLAQSTVETSGSSIAVGGTAALTARAKDAAGNALTTGGLTVAFTQGSGTSEGTIGSITDNANGTYGATFTGTTAGSARTIGATLNGAAITSTLPTITVGATTGPIAASTSVVTTSASTVTSGSSVTITLQAKDANGTNLGTGGATVTFSLGSGTSTGTIGTVTDNANGTYTATLTGVLVGTARAVNATINGSAVTTAAPTVTVTPGSPSAATSTVASTSSSIAAGSTSTLTLTARDAAGNSVTTGGATVAFSLAASSGTSAGTIGTVTDNTNGTYTAVLTGTTAGTARALASTLNSSAVTTTMPSLTVVPGPISLVKSLVSVAVDKLKVGGTSSLTLTAKDAYENAITTGGQTVAFSVSGGTSAGTIGTVTDNANGTYAATFTASTTGTAVSIGATIGGSAVTSALPSLVVYTPGITFSSDSVVVNATTGQAASSQLVGVFANGGATAAGLSASVSYTNNGIASCTSSNWLGTPTFDFTSANPVSIVTLSPTAASLGVYSCAATITISSTTPDVASRAFKVVIAVARGAVTQTAVNLVFMGNAGNAATQNMIPDAKILITNGGRGTLTGLHAFVDTARSNSVDTAWITGADLSWDPPVADTNARSAPRTLIVSARVRPSFASASIRVTGTGMSPIYIPLNVLFNTAAELVTNPRGVAVNGFAGGSSVQSSVIAFNQNRTVANTLKNYRINTSVALPAWLTASAVTMTPDTAGTVTVTANPSALLPDSVYTDTVRVLAEEFSGATSIGDKQFRMPVRFVVERGLVLAVADATLFSAAGTTVVTKDIAITNGGSTTISGLTANFAGASWLTATFVGGTGAPTTLRLTANPTGLPRGSVLTTTVTISASSPGGVPSKTLPVTFRVY